jgi:hypothetical protein
MGTGDRDVQPTGYLSEVCGQSDSLTLSSPGQRAVS